MKRYSVLSLLFIFPLLHWGQSDVAPKYVNEFLNIGAGARGYAMSGANTASSQDGFSAYWNPAGLALLQQPHTIGLMHAEYFAGIAKFDFGSYIKKIDPTRSVGFSMLRFGVDNIPNTIDLYDPSGNVDYSRISYFSAADYAFVISYAQQGLPSFLVKNKKEASPKWMHSWGANAKIIYRQIGDFAKGFGFGLDAGWQAKQKNWQLGIVAKDITTTFNAWSYTLDQKTQSVFQETGNEIPTNHVELALPRLIMGGGRIFYWSKYSLLAEANLIVTTDGHRNTLISGHPFSGDPALGLEFGYQQWLFLRGGIGNFQRTAGWVNDPVTFQPNIGLGIKFRGFQLDYALTDIGNQSDVLYTNMFSLTYSGALGQKTVQQNPK
jgi:hypothetical protein